MSEYIYIYILENVYFSFKQKLFFVLVVNIFQNGFWKTDILIFVNMCILKRIQVLRSDSFFSFSNLYAFKQNKTTSKNMS